MAITQRAGLGSRDYARGLTSNEAAARFAADGPNELPAAAARDITRIALEVVRDPTFVLLLMAGTVYLILGDFHEAVLLLSFVVMIVGITVYQEHKTERALQALRELTSPRALVVRDGERMRIAGREVVRGDILLVTEGDRVPADAVLLSANDVLADESLLTGESVSVRKTAWDGVQQMTRPGGDGLPFIYSGTLLTRGQTVAEVAATGVGTEIGRIGVALSSGKAELTPLQQQTAHMIRRIAGVAIALAVLLVVLYGWIRGGWLDAVLAGITLAMGILPQEFPVVLTVFLALGAWRISKQRVLTRRIPAIET
ncbi:MAG: cation-transporting P-type ATPase, partial [Sulfuricaulis sp.]|nr:cation-transporting P-type ATPase [Sulfuricaulis sp.]